MDRVETNQVNGSGARPSRNQVRKYLSSNPRTSLTWPPFSFCAHFITRTCLPPVTWDVSYSPIGSPPRKAFKGIHFSQRLHFLIFTETFFVHALHHHHPFLGGFFTRLFSPPPPLPKQKKKERKGMTKTFSITFML